MAMGSSSDGNEQDNLWRWLSHSEDSIFLLDGLNNLKDLLVPTPEELPPCDNFDRFIKNGEDLDQLVSTIKDGIHKTHYKAHIALFNYRMQALNGLWKARKTAKFVADELVAERRKRAESSKGQVPGQYQGLVSDNAAASELTLLMLFPLIESQTRSDPGLKTTITQLLVDFFKKAAPLSIKGPTNQLDGIENLLIDWINDVNDENNSIVDTLQALVALTCSRDSIDTLVRTVHVLMNLDLKGQDLKVSDLLTNVLRLDYEDDQPKILDVHYHSRGFHYNAKRTANSTHDDSKHCECKESVRRSIIAQDDKYLLVSNDTGCHLARIGSGYGGSIAGHVYTKSKSCLEPGLFAEVNGILLHRPFSHDKITDKFGYMVNGTSLEKGQDIDLPSELQIPRGGEVKTIFVSAPQKNVLIWLRLVSADMETLNLLPQSHVVVSDVCSLGQHGELSLKQRRVLLKNPESNETIARLLKCLATPKKEEISTEVKFPTDSQSTTCGLRASTLMESPIVVDEQYVIVLTPNPDSRTGNKACRTLGTAFAFDLSSGILHSQTDVQMEPGLSPPSLPKGFSIASSALVYCPGQHQFWALAYNRIDEFGGKPGSESGSYIKLKLNQTPCDETIDSRLVAVAQLLEHTAIQMMKMNGNVQLKSSTIQKVLQIMSMLQNSMPHLSLMAIQILGKADIDQEDSEEIVRFLDHTLESVKSDDASSSMMKQIINLRLKLGSETFLDQMKALFQIKNLTEEVLSFLKRLYLSRMIQQMPDKVDIIQEEAWSLFVKLFKEEIQSCLEETIQAISTLQPSRTVITLQKNSHLANLVDVICLTGSWAAQNPSNLGSLFGKIFEIASHGCMSLTGKVASLKIKPDEINPHLATSLVGPTFYGCLLSFAKAAPLKGQGFLHLLTEQFCKIARLVSTQEVPQKLENLLPWIFTRNVASPHPVREGYKLQETVKLPGAKCLLLIFDERCSTMSEMDRLSVFSGPSMSSKKIVECSGNNKSARKIGQKPWPKKPILVFGDCVTIDFEVKSKQDPDSTMSWGCQISIGHCPADLFEANPTGILDNALLMLVPLLAQEVDEAYEGSAISVNENQCSHLLSSKILQRCNWKLAKLEQMIQVLENTSAEDILPPISLIPSKTTSILRNLAGLGLPIMRESIRKLIQPNLLEEAIVSSVIKHMGLESTLDSFLQDQDPNTPDGCLLSDIMVDVYLKISSLVRKLQAIAELESKWNNEVKNVRDGHITLKEVFFNDYLHHEARAKDLSLLCFLKKVKNEKPQKALQFLKDALQREAASEPPKGLSQTTALIKGIFCRLDLLLRAEIEASTSACATPQMSMSLQNWPPGQTKSLKRQQSNEVERLLDDAILKITKLQRSVSKVRRSRSIIESFEAPLDLESNPETIVSELFVFIGSSPEDSVPGVVFLKAILERLNRCQGRLDALRTMNALMKAVHNLPNSLIKSVSGTFADIFSKGLRFKELLCCKSITKTVLHTFSECLQTLVNAGMKSPKDNHATIGLICATPYSKDEEECLVQSGLLILLNSLSDGQEVLEAKSSAAKSLSHMAWAGFKILAKRCVQWEASEEDIGMLRSSGLEKQVSKLLSNHLTRAVECGHKSIGLDAVQESLSLLKDLSSTKMGKGILAQPACATSLLHFLMDPNVSPHITHTVISLLQESLPFMNHDDLSDVSVQQGGSDQFGVEALVTQLLLSRLSKLLTPSIETENPFETTDSHSHEAPQNRFGAMDDGSHQALLVHKRPDQSGHELIQQLLNASSDIGIFSAMGSDSMEKIIRIDKDVNQNNLAEVMVSDATRILRAATKMAQLGFVVSISAPNQFHESSNEWRHRATQICCQRNDAVAQNHPLRPFISSNVANKLVAEIIILIQRLMNSENCANWRKAIQGALDDSFALLPVFLSHLPKLANDESFDIHIFEIGQKIAGSLAMLGSFYETIKPGSAVVLNHQTCDSNISDGIVKKICKENNSVTVLVNSGVSDETVEITVPTSKVRLEENIQDTSQKLFMPLVKDQIQILQSLLLPTDEGIEPLCAPLPVTSESKNICALSRLAGEIRSRSCQLLALHLNDRDFAKTFLEQSCQSVDMLKYFSKEVLPSDKLCCTEYLCENLRGKFKDQTKPSALSLPIQANASLPPNQWNAMQIFPPLKSVIFTHNQTSVTYLGTPVTSIGQPRGVVLQATKPMGAEKEESKFVMHILSLGEGSDESGAPTISLGLSPLGSRKDGAWNHAEGALMLHSNGRIVHYKGSNILSWQSTRIDCQLNPGDEVVIRWFPQDGDMGNVKFEVNNIQVANVFTDVPVGLFPTMHIQQKGVRVNAVFPDLDEKGNTASQDTVDKFLSHEVASSSSTLGGHRRQWIPLSRQAIRMKPLEASSPELSSSHFRLALHGYSKLSAGGKPLSLQDVDWVEEEDDEDFDEFSEERTDDLNSLLVKSWEERVFPAIRRRFRNESERRDGLDQIKGALSLGMIDIAKQTVEFLYEENGGLPTDLKLPDLDDVKKDLMSLSIEKLRPGMIVNLVRHEQQPLFACKEQLKTFGLEGEVIRTDIPNELAEVETYIEEDGTVVRYWYPVDALRKSSNERQCARGKKSLTGSNAQLELLNCEFVLSRLYCREAYLRLLKWTNDDNFNITTSSDNDSPEKKATLASNIFLLQDWDMENILYCLDSKSLPCHGSSVEGGNSFKSPQEALCQIPPKITSMILHENHKAAMTIIGNILDRMQSTNPVLAGELLTEIIQSLREFEACIPHENIHINDISMVTSTIYFPNASCVFATIKFKAQQTLQHPDGLKVIVQPMEFIVKQKELQHSTNLITKYPSMIKGGKNINLRSFSPVMFSANTLKIYHGGASDSKAQVHLVGFPNTVLLALTLIDFLVQQKVGELEAVTVAHYHEALEHLSLFLMKFELPPWCKTLLFYSASGLIKYMREKAMKIQTKTTEKLLDKLTLELEKLAEAETKTSGQVTLHSMYCQSLMELCYQLHPIAQYMALDLPKRLEQVSITMSVLHTLKYQHELPKSVMQSIPVVEQLNFGGRYLVLTGIPRLMSSLEVAASLKKSLSCLGGLQVVEVFCTTKTEGNQSVNTGSAVIQIQTCSMQEEAKMIIANIAAFHQTSHFDVHHETGTVIPLIVSKIRMDLQCEEATCCCVWVEFLKSKLIVSSGKLKADVASAAKSIFVSSMRDPGKGSLKFSDLLLKKKNPFLAFLNGIKGRPATDIRDDLREFFSTNKEDKSDDKLTIDGVWEFMEQLAKQDIISLVRAFQACGYDLDMKPMGSISHAEDTYTTWSIDEDIALVEYLNQWCEKFNMFFQDIQPNEFRWDCCDMRANGKSKLSDKLDHDIRSRICLLKGMNSMVACDVAPLVNFDANQGLSHELQSMKKIFFSSWKMQMLTSLINATAEKNDDQPGIIINLNPLENLEKGSDSLASTWFFQSYTVVSESSSSNLCIATPHSDDPQFPFLIKLSGEEVQGNSGSFRQFLARIVEELHSTAVPLLMPYMGNGPYKGMYMIRPGPLQLLDEQLLIYFGQLLAVAVRSGIPLPIGLIPQFWKSLIDDPVTDEDLANFDPDIFKYLQDLQSVSSAEAFDIFLENHHHPSFTIQAVSGTNTELIDGGQNTLLTFSNRNQYIDLIKAFRRNEVESKCKVNCILAGMYTVLPMGIVKSLFTWEEAQFRICGSDTVDLNLLKKYTIYQVGISEEDQHIQNFWTVIFSLSPQQLKLFIKFACNQERIPKPHDSNNLPPPYPMKIAPADAREEIQDNLLIRAETCIFMIKVPRYSTLDVMREKLLYSIQSAEDPLSG